MVEPFRAVIWGLLLLQCFRALAVTIDVRLHHGLTSSFEVLAKGPPETNLFQ